MNHHTYYPLLDYIRNYRGALLKAGLVQALLQTHRGELDSVRAGEVVVEWAQDRGVLLCEDVKPLERDDDDGRAVQLEAGRSGPGDEDESGELRTG